jgi:hypothetical protein
MSLPQPSPWGCLRSIATRLLALAAIALYLAITLAPFRLEPPRYVENAIEREERRWGFPAPSLAVTEAPPEWLAPAMASGSLVVELWVRPASERQEGPARILALSGTTAGRADLHQQNLVVGQDGTDLVLRVRRPGAGGLGEPQLVDRDALRAQRWHHVRIALGSSIRLFVDGERRAQVDDATGWGSTWDPSHILSIGNTPSGGRPWYGEVASLTVEVEGARQEVLRDELFAFPERFWVIPARLQEGGEGPGPQRAAVGAAHVVVGGGLLAAAWLLQVGRSARRTLRGVVVLIIVANAAKIWVATRHPSVGTALLQVGGSGLAFVLVETWSSRGTSRYTARREPEAAPNFAADTRVEGHLRDYDPDDRGTQ